MQKKDDFPHEARWNSVGLDCSQCKNQKSPNKWPDIHRVLSCNLHHFSLDVLLNKKGYQEGEWFCKSFENIGGANLKAVNHFENTKHQLMDDVLYGFYGDNGYLKEIPFAQLRKIR